MIHQVCAVYHRVLTGTENQGKIKIKFQVWKNQGICKKVGQIREKLENFITGEINQGILLWFHDWWMWESRTVLGYQYYILVISICIKWTSLGYTI